MIKKEETYLPLKKRRELLNTFHLSASGWRKIFFHPSAKKSAQQQNLSLPDKTMLVSAFFSLADFFQPRITNKKNHYLLLAADTRQSGKEMLRLSEKIFQHLQIPTQNVGAMALPEILAHVSQEALCDGFIYFSASHNPPEHNGIKMGLGDGCVLNQDLASIAIDLFRQRYLSLKHKKDVEWLCTNAPTKSHGDHDIKPHFLLVKKMHEHYENLIEKITFFSSSSLKTTKEEKSIYQKSFAQLKENLRQQQQSVVIDYNGSARLFCCEQTILQQYGLHCHALGDQAGIFNHEIVPEGKSLDFLEKSMKKLLEKNRKIFAGMVVDCDGDRGNLLLVNPENKKILRLSAQKTFALGVLSDLAALQTFFPHKLKKLAIIINEASSLLVDYLCSLYGVECFRSETGEANVLKLAEKKRTQGYEVRIAGEGSNGGSIVFPHTVRDPLTTLLGILRLCYLKKDGILLARQTLEKMRSFHGESSPTNDAHLLENILEKFNQFRSTPVFQREALIDLKLTHLPKGKIKKLKQLLIKKCWEDNGRTIKDLLENENITIKVKQYLGHQEKSITNKTQLNSIKDNGGIVIYFYEKKHSKTKMLAKGFWWMRTSQTESKLRCATEWSAENSEKKTIKAAEKKRFLLQQHLYDFLNAHI